MAALPEVARLFQYEPTGVRFAAIGSALTAKLGEEHGIVAGGALLGRWIAESIAVSID